MKIRLVRYWEELRASYWFVPGLMATAAAALATGIIYFDWLVHVGRVRVLDRLYLIVTDPSGARIVLSTIAGSAITVAGVVFSITVVVLNMAAAQFGPRLLRNFMEEAGTQRVLGIFVGAFIYCVIVLSAMRSEGGQVFVPQYAVAVGILLGVSSFAALIYFIHHVSVFIQAPRIIDNVATGLERSFRTSFDERRPGGLREGDSDLGAAEDAGPTPLAAARWRAVPAGATGYVQAVDYSGLLELAATRDLVLRLTCRAGHFMIAEHPLAHAAPSERLDDEAMERIAEAFILGPDRTPTQDPEFAVRQLVEIALRALSPGINDPFTAINCVDRLAAALSLLGAHQPGPRCRRDQEGRLRLVTQPCTYGGIVDASLNQIRQHARGNVAVSLRLLGAITEIGRSPLPPQLRGALFRQAEAIHETNRELWPAAKDREELAEYYRGACERLAR